MKKRNAPLSLWSIVESLQRRLERQGCSREVIAAPPACWASQAPN